MKNNISTEVIAAYDMMLETVEEYLKSSNYFTIELKHKFSDYEYKLTDISGDTKIQWKNFFAETQE